jgi:hypothetical protein
MARIIITANWDQDAGVWVAESEQIGLVTEAPDLDSLRAKLPDMIRDLLEDDEPGIIRGLVLPLETDVPFEVVAHYHERVHVRRA